MHIVKTGFAVFAATVALTAATHAAEIKKQVEAPGTLESVWTMFGDFCAVKDWHPAVVECEQFEEDGDTYRTLTLADGGKIKEILTGKDGTSYSYDIIESPFPVKNYSATFEVNEDDDENTVEIEWEAKFEPADGVEEAKAVEVMDGVLEAGIASIGEKAKAAN